MHREPLRAHLLERIRSFVGGVDALRRGRMWWKVFRL